MINFFYPASYLPNKNHSLLNSLLVNRCLASYGLKIYLTISDSDMVFASSDIILLGRISHETCMHYLKRSSALLFLSSFESLGLPLIEATQLGKPVICPDLIYARELLGDSPYYFRAQSPESLCNTFSKFIQNHSSPNVAMLNKPLHRIGYAWTQFTNTAN